MPKPDLGSKRQCQNCSAKFFDLNKDPIVCPKCGTVYQVTPLSARASRAAPAAVEDEADVDAGAELVPLEEADADEDKAVAAVVDDDAEEVEDDAADTFLEEEEDGDDDVSDLIDGDIETDEER